MKQIGYILRISLTLLLIAAVVAGALAGVNALTKERIAAIAAEKTQKAVSQVLEGEAQLLDVAVTGNVRSVYKSESGYAVEVAVPGFGGDISMMVGIGNDGTVTGISVIRHTETAGLGSVAGENTEKGNAFRSQYVGKGGELAVKQDGGQIDALTGATITSRAVTAGVNEALAFVKALG